MKEKIENVINEDNEIKNKLKENIEIFYKDECKKRLDKPLKENENLLVKIKNFLNNWDNNYNKTDKVNALKSNVIKNFENDAILNSNVLKENTENFKGK